MLNENELVIYKFSIISSRNNAKIENYYLHFLVFYACISNLPLCYKIYLLNLYQRKELCKLHEKLENQKKSLLETIANRKKFLSSLPSHLKSLKKASLPIQNQLGVLHTKKLKQYHSAELLPPPLYVIYSQLLAQKEAFGEPIDLETIGSLKDAQAFACHQAHKDTGNKELMCHSSNSFNLL